MAAGTSGDHCRDFYRRVTGTGQQVAQLYDSYLHDDDDDHDDDVLI
jgi:hypothetical protein